MTSSEDPVMVIVRPAGMSIEQSPEGTKPSVHVSGSSNKPDFFAVKVKVTRLGAGTEKKDHHETVI